MTVILWPTRGHSWNTLGYYIYIYIYRRFFSIGRLLLIRMMVAMLWREPSSRNTVSSGQFGRPKLRSRRSCTTVFLLAHDSLHCQIYQVLSLVHLKQIGNNPIWVSITAGNHTQWYSVSDNSMWCWSLSIQVGWSMTLTIIGIFWMFTRVYSISQFKHTYCIWMVYTYATQRTWIQIDK